MAITELETLAQIDLDDSNVIFVSLNDIGGGKLAVDVRRWYVDQETGEWRPTGKGISLSAKYVEQIASVLADAAVRDDVIAAANPEPRKAPAKKAAAKKAAAPAKRPTAKRGARRS